MPTPPSWWNWSRQVADHPACSAFDEGRLPQSVRQCVRQSVKLRSPQSAYDRDPSMDAAVALLAFITLQRFVEFIWDRRNTRRLRAAGAVEFSGLHYPAMMLVHAGWLAGLWGSPTTAPSFQVMSPPFWCCRSA